MFWDFYQQHQIGRLQSQSQRATSKVERSANHIKELERKVDSLALACQSLWELLRDRTGLTEEELESKMEEIDLRDGKLDGKLGNIIDECRKCGRKTSRKRPNCLYCGESTNSPSEFFDR